MLTLKVFLPRNERVYCASMLKTEMCMYCIYHIFKLSSTLYNSNTLWTTVVGNKWKYISEESKGSNWKVQAPGKLPFTSFKFFNFIECN